MKASTFARLIRGHDYDVDALNCYYPWLDLADAKRKKLYIYIYRDIICIGTLYIEALYIEALLYVEALHIGALYRASI